MKLFITGVFAAATLAAMSVAAPASATPGQSDISGVRNESVRVGDLNLTHATDVASLYWRLRTAATRVCTTGTSAIARVDEPCYRRTLGEAVAKIDNASLTALHERRAPVRQLAANGV